jgi:hypothetical protein
MSRLGLGLAGTGGAGGGFRLLRFAGEDMTISLESEGSPFAGISITGRFLVGLRAELGPRIDSSSEDGVIGSEFFVPVPLAGACRFAPTFLEIGELYGSK